MPLVAHSAGGRSFLLNGTSPSMVAATTPSVSSGS
jgi:hypothetical protein